MSCQVQTPNWGQKIWLTLIPVILIYLLPYQLGIYTFKLFPFILEHRTFHWRVKGHFSLQHLMIFSKHWLEFLPKIQFVIILCEIYLACNLACFRSVDLHNHSEAGKSYANNESEDCCIDCRTVGSTNTGNKT